MSAPVGHPTHRAFLRNGLGHWAAPFGLGRRTPPALLRAWARMAWTSSADEPMMVALYHETRRAPDEGTATAAILAHAQACGLVAYLLDVHPDRVARAVADATMKARGGGGA